MTCTIYILAPSITLKKGGSYKLKVKNGTGVKWSSNNKGVATVSSKGVVKARKAGKATITAKVGKKKLTCKVTVKKANNKSDKGNGGKVNISKDEKKQLPYTGDGWEARLDISIEDGCIPLNKPTDLFSYLENNNNPIKVTSNLVKTKYYKWFSSDNNILSIDKYGIATGHKEGKVKVYFKFLSKNGKWGTSRVANIKVRDAGNVSFNYQFGYDDDLYSNSTLPIRYFYKNDTLEKNIFNFVKITISNNSDKDIKFMRISFSPSGIAMGFKPAMVDSVQINPGESNTIICNRAFTYDVFDKPFDINTKVDQTSINSVMFTYTINGKSVFINYDIINNRYTYYC